MKTLASWSAHALSTHPGVWPCDLVNVNLLVKLPLQIALTKPGGFVLGYCPVEKHTTVPLSANQMGWRIAAECCGSHAGTSTPWILTKSQTVLPAKPPPPCFTVGTTHAEIIRSPTRCLTKTWRLEPKISHLDSSDQRTDFLRSYVHCSCFLAQASLFFMLVSFCSGFFAAIRPWRPDSHSFLWTVDVAMCLLFDLCEAFIWPAISDAGNCNDLMLCTRGNSGSSIPVMVLMRASVIIALEILSKFLKWSVLTDHLKVMMDCRFSLLIRAVLGIIWTWSFTK